MKFFDRLLGRKTEKKLDAMGKLPIWANPTAYNRVARRAAGVRGRISPFAPEALVFVPRFVRRHAGQKRHRAKSIRIMRAYGLIG